jgi:hypothetical protein
MKTKSNQLRICSIAVALAFTATCRLAVAGGAGAPEPGAGCTAAFPGQVCEVIHGAPYAGETTLSEQGQFLIIGETVATQMGSGDQMFVDQTGVALGNIDFDALSRRDVQGACVSASTPSEGTGLAEVLAVRRLVGPMHDQYEVDALLVPVVCTAGAAQGRGAAGSGSR